MGAEHPPTPGDLGGGDVRRCRVVMLCGISLVPDPKSRAPGHSAVGGVAWFVCTFAIGERGTEEKSYYVGLTKA